MSLAMSAASGLRAHKISRTEEMNVRPHALTKNRCRLVTMCVPESRVNRRSAFCTVRRAGLRNTSRTITQAAAEDAPSASESSSTMEQATPPEDSEEAETLRKVKFVQDSMEKLRVGRDMEAEEVRLIIGMEDPDAKLKREVLGIEDDSAVSREDLSLALKQILDGYIPGDDLSLCKLVEEFENWPGLGDVIDEASQGRSKSTYAQITDTGVEVDLTDSDTGGDVVDAPAGSIMGWIALYGVSAVPIFIGLTVLTIAFVTSLK